MTSLALPSATIASPAEPWMPRLERMADMAGVAILLSGVALGAVMFVAQSL